MVVDVLWCVMSVKRAVVAAAVLFALVGCGANSTTAPPPPSAPVSAVAETAWAPAGMKSVGFGVAAAWIPAADVVCKSYQSTCWGLTIASQHGCPRGYYVQIAISKPDGTIIDTANDITAGLAPNERVEVVLSPPDDPPAGAQAKLNELNCLGS